MGTTVTVPKFRLGQTVMTTPFSDALDKAGDDLRPYFRRYLSGDWGECGEEDWATNDESIAHEGDPDQQQRVLAVYRLSDGTKFWIITEWDRSVTTFLLPDDY